MVADNLCAYYTVTVRDADTQQNRCPIENVVSFSFNRVETASSKLSVVVNLDDDCCPDCAPRPWVDEVAIDRVSADGVFEATVWVGPVRRVVNDRIVNQSTIEAYDRSSHWAARANDVIDLTGVQDQTTLWLTLVKQFEEVGASRLLIGEGELTNVLVDAQLLGNTTVETEEVITTDADGNITTTTATTRTTNQSNSGVVDLIFGGLSSVRWTVVGNRLYGPGPAPVDTNPFGAFNAESDWIGGGGLVIDTDGSNQVSQVKVEGVDRLNAPITGVYPASPTVDRGGPRVRSVVSNEVFLTQAKANLAAKTIYDANRSADRFVVTSTDSLSSESGFTVHDLIPGRVFWVISDTECDPDPVRQQARVYNVVVQGVAEDARVRESAVRVDFGPVGSVETSIDRASI